MVKSLHFHGGAFPANFGDKMSSALELDYHQQFPSQLGGMAKGNLFNFGLVLHKGHQKFSWIGGVRYANPELFVNKLQTNGDYRPL
ncbi:MAG: hypothetical protein GWN61_14075, partial [candidate division Zixibacteria bacterium]|nr:hypothetical protein [candidate division Zixibacteria bacterium]NIV07266.1 hypothetical protein [candidate division Zixibacteria bacterium]